MRTLFFKVKNLECMLSVSADNIRLRVINPESGIITHRFIYDRSEKLLLHASSEPFADIQEIGYREAKLVITDWILEYAMGR